jgi:CheY-like chemotaxis protein
LRVVAGEGAPDPALRRGGQPRILLAEDNVVNQKVAVRMLEKLGCSIDVAVDGAEAVEMWRHFAYDLIFMDCQMPELDGLAATREIRADELAGARSRTPIVAMTANAMHQDRSDCLDAGMDDYLSKPVSFEELQGMLARWIRLESLRQAAGLESTGRHRAEHRERP